MRYPGDSSYGRCDDCGGAAYSMGPGRVQLCRECCGDRANFIARNAHARREALFYVSEEFGEQYRNLWNEAAIRRREFEKPLREMRYAHVKANVEAFERGEFEPNRSLHDGLFQLESKWHAENPYPEPSA